MRRRCIVSLGTSGWFVRGVDRLEASLCQVGWAGAFMGWRDAYPPGSPTQEQVDHGFKAWCVHAALGAGHEAVMWCDASVWAVHDPAPIFEHAERTGFYIVYNGFWVGQYSSDRSLEIFGVTREEAFQIRDIAAGFICMDLRQEAPRHFLAEWLRYTTLAGGAAYNGPDSNDGSISSDPRVKGHRHDQTVASLILHRMGYRDGIPFGESLIDTGHNPRAGKKLTYHGM